MSELTPQQNFVLYTSTDGEIKLEVFLQDETIWLTQKMMAELFGVDIRTVNEHLQKIYKTVELSDKSTIRNFRIVQKEGERDVEREISFYNLDAIISVGYRVNSTRATQFRTDVTKEFFATVQNTFHFAITGQTAAEIIYMKADKSKPNMGLTTWKNSPSGRVKRCLLLGELAKDIFQC